MKRLSQFLQEEFSQKIYRLSLSSGCTCPNRDGKISYGGCTFCSEGGSGEFAAPFMSLDKQIEDAKKRVASKTGADKYIAYFQSFTGTYDSADRLYKLYYEAITRDDIVALSIGTRPDCLDDDILEMLGKLNTIKPVWIELGLQTVHEETALRINRGYTLDVFEKAYRDLKNLGIAVIVHVIFGLPGESEEDMLETARYLANLDPMLDGVKLQNLQILKGTEIGRQYLESPFYVMSLQEYAQLIAKCDKIFPESTVLHRMTGDGPRSLLIEPKWSLDKKRVLNTINAYLDGRTV